MSNIFVNLENRNNYSSPLAITVDESREPVILHNPELYNVTIDRFSLHKAWLPCYENAHNLTLQLVRKSDSNTQTQQLDFTGKVDNNGLMYNRKDFITVLNAAIQAACEGFGLTAPFPTMSLAATTGIATLDYSGVANFADLYTLQFNEPLYCIFSTLPYDDVKFDQDYFKLDLDNANPYTISGTEDVNLSPVDRIYIKCNTMPLVYEFAPTSKNSRNSEAILTDFEFGGANKYPLQTVNYSATSNGQYRFHTLVKGVFKRLRLEFHYKTYANNTFPLQYLPSGSVNVKLLFAPNYEKYK